MRLRHQTDLMKVEMTRALQRLAHGPVATLVARATGCRRLWAVGTHAFRAATARLLHDAVWYSHTCQCTRRWCVC